MRVIHKTLIDFSTNGKLQAVQLPYDADFLSIQEQYGKIAIWYLCNPTVEKKEFFFKVFGTGVEITNEVGWIHKSTIQHQSLVFHVFHIY